MKDAFQAIAAATARQAYERHVAAGVAPEAAIVTITDALPAVLCGWAREAIEAAVEDMRRAHMDGLLGRAPE